MWLKLLIGVALNVVLGMIWFSPLMFGNVWKKEVRPGKNNPGKYIIVMLMALISTYFLIHLFNLLGIRTFMTGALYGSVISLGFVAVPVLNATLWEDKSAMFLLIDAGFYFVYYFLLGGIIAVI